jgi:hypothetical protein
MPHNGVFMLVRSGERLVDREKALQLYSEYGSFRTVAQLLGVGKDKVASIVNGARAAALTRSVGR